MTVLTSTSIDHPAQLAGLCKSFAASVIRCITAAKQQEAGKFLEYSNILAGVGTGAAMTVMSLALLRIMGG